MENPQIKTAPLVVLPTGRLGYRTTLPEYPDYFFYSDGRVFNKRKNRFLITQSVRPKAYIKVRLVGADRVNDTYNLHVIIALAFLGKIPAGLVVDHKNGDRHDNKITNLRYVQRTHNNYNRVSARNSSSKFLGVSLGRNGRWAANIKANGQAKYLGRFDTEEEAATAYQIAKDRLHIIPAFVRIPVL